MLAKFFRKLANDKLHKFCVNSIECETDLISWQIKEKTLFERDSLLPYFTQLWTWRKSFSYYSCSKNLARPLSQKNKNSARPVHKTYFSNLKCKIVEYFWLIISFTSSIIFVFQILLKNCIFNFQQFFPYFCFNSHCM